MSLAQAPMQGLPLLIAFGRKCFFVRSRLGQRSEVAGDQGSQTSALAFAAMSCCLSQRNFQKGLFNLPFWSTSEVLESWVDYERQLVYTDLL